MSSVQESTLGLVNNNDHAVIWLWKSNINPSDNTTRPQWKKYRPYTSSIIENAYKNRQSTVVIDNNYMIDFKNMIQINLHDSNQQTAVERCESEDVKNEMIESIRYLFPLNSIPNTIEDNGLVYGCEYVFYWIQTCNNGNSNPKTKEIFPLLIKGIETEAHIAKVSMKTLTDIIDELQQTRQRFKHRRERLRMKFLCECCAKIYTYECFLYKVLNTTLRKNNFSKLETLGPYCFLLYNHIGSHVNNAWISRYQQRFRHITMTSLFVYRGDFASEETINEYKKAVGQINKYFKWTTFVSTSKQRAQAEGFESNALYIIRLIQADINDQYSDLTEISYYPNEQEVLLAPGVRFKVQEVTFNDKLRQNQITIDIVPSYMFN
ncbi:unnamed protein product [Rotaria sordida]|uniref:WWE domain-containing protein n=1 Tax=Rotaria sordida TaxID=392033 RepID=A0A818TQ81_9BILA|nr:unnamed protein product [Rotaria sordida]